MLAVSVLLSPAEAGSLLLVACTQRLSAGLIPGGTPRLGPAKSVVRNLFCVERIFPGIDRMKKRGLPAAKTAHSTLQRNGTLDSAAKRAHSTVCPLSRALIQPQRMLSQRVLAMMATFSERRRAASSFSTALLGSWRPRLSPWTQTSYKKQCSRP